MYVNQFVKQVDKSVPLLAGTESIDIRVACQLRETHYIQFAIRVIFPPRRPIRRFFLFGGNQVRALGC